MKQLMIATAMIATAMIATAMTAYAGDAKVHKEPVTTAKSGAYVDGNLGMAHVLTDAKSGVYSDDKLASATILSDHRADMKKVREANAESAPKAPVAKAATTKDVYVDDKLGMKSIMPAEESNFDDRLLAMERLLSQ